MSKQQRNKGPKKPKPAPVKKSEPKFVYTSQCCGVQANKPPLENVGLVKATEAHGLGKFRCTKCGRACKCNRARAKKEETHA